MTFFHSLITFSFLVSFSTVFRVLETIDFTGCLRGQGNFFSAKVTFSHVKVTFSHA